MFLDLNAATINQIQCAIIFDVDLKPVLDKVGFANLDNYNRDELADIVNEFMEQNNECW